MEDVIKRIKRKYASFEKEFGNEDGMIDVALACELANSIPYLIEKIEQLQSVRNENTLDKTIN